MRLGLFAQRFNGLLVLLLKFLFHLLAACAVLLALENCRDGGAQIGRQLFHVILELDPGAGRELHHTRLVLLLEVVDVTPVRWWRLARGLVVQKLAHYRAFAGAGLTEHEQVVAVAANANAEFQRRHGARLAENLLQVVEFGGGCERELSGVALCAQSLPG